MRELDFAPGVTRHIETPTLREEAHRRLFTRYQTITIPRSRLMVQENVKVPGSKMLSVGPKNKDNGPGNSWEGTRWLSGDLPRFLRHAPTVNRISEGVWVSNWESTNLFHWFSESLPRALWARSAGIQAPVLVPHWLARHGFVPDTLRLLSLEFVVLSAKVETVVENFFFPELRAPIGDPRPDDVNQLRERLWEGLAAAGYSPQERPTGRIWISRQSSPRRRESSWPTVSKTLTRFGFDLLEPEDYSISELLFFVMNSSTVAGLHGAGLANSWVMRPTGVLLEFREENDVQNNCYMSLGQILGLDYRYGFAKRGALARSALGIPEAELERSLEMIS